ncbi:MAG: PAS domain S-box protein [Pseudomonadota bacterium]
MKRRYRVIGLAIVQIALTLLLAYLSTDPQTVLICGALLTVVSVSAAAVLARNIRKTRLRVEQRMSDFADSATEFLWETDSDHRFSWFSRSHADMTGMDPSGLLGKRRDEVLRIEPEPESWRKHQAHLEARQPFRDFEYNNLNNSGELRTFRVSGKPVFGRGGKFMGYRGTGRDVTEAVRVEQAQVRLNSAIQQLPDAIALFDTRDLLVSCNTAYAQRFVVGAAAPPGGFTFEGLLRHGMASVLQLGVAGDLHLEARLRQHRIADGTVQSLLLRDGTRAVARDFRTADGGVMVVITDVTQLTLREEQLRAYDMRFWDFMETAVDWFWETDADDRFTFVSPQLERVAGVAEDDVIGLQRSDFAGLDPNEPGIIEISDRVARRERFTDLTFSRRLRTGEIRYFRISGKPATNEQGEFTGYRGTGRDVTDVELAELRAHSAERRLVDALEWSSDGVALYDADDRLVMYNSAYRDHYIGAQDTPITGRKFVDIMRLGVRHGSIAQDQPKEAIFARRQREHALANGVPQLYARRDGGWMQIRETRTTEGGVLMVLTDVTEQQRIDQMLRAMVAPDATDTDNILSLTLRSVCAALGMRIGVVAMRESDDTMMTLCAIDNGEELEPFTYDLHGSPCEHALVSPDPVVLTERAAALFPQDAMLVDGGIEAYVGTSLHDHTGETVGLFVLMHDEPVRDTPTMESIPRLVADRIGLELQREAAVMALQASESNLRAVFDNAPIRMWLKDLDGRFLNVSEKWLRDHDLTEREVIGLSDREVLADVHWLDDALAMDAAVVKSGGTITGEVQRGTPDAPQDFLIQRFPVFDGAGALRALGTATTEVTAVKQAEARAKYAFESLEAAIASMTDGFALYDSAQTLVVCNDRLRMLFPEARPYLLPGASRADVRRAVLTSARLRTVNEQRPADLPPDIVTGGGQGDEQLEMLDGSWVQLREHQAEDRALIVVATDITERKQIESMRESRQEELERVVTERTRDLEAAREELIQAERLATIGRLAATVSHELRNPLGTARNSVYLLRRRVESDSPLLRHLDTVEREISHCDSVISSLLESTRVKSPNVGNLILTRMLEELLPGITRPDGVAVDISGCEGLTVVADQTQLRQVLTNLLSNAVQASPPGSVVHVAGERAGSTNRFWVSDQGDGIPADKLDRVFEPFYTTRSRGAGLGLWISRELLRRHGGDLSVHNNASGGATFVAELPLQ